MTGSITEIDIKQLRSDKLKQILDLAGFKVIMRERCVELIDKESKDADKYSDLTFIDLYDAVMSVKPYLKNQFKFVA